MKDFKMEGKRKFKLSSEKIKYLEEKYKQRVVDEHWKLEKEILNFSEKKDLGYEELKKIVKWKTPRISKRFNKYWQGRDDEIREITRDAFRIIMNKKDDQDAIKKAIDELDQLGWVGIGVATAILMSYDKEKFTVMDWRVWNILFLCCYLKEPYPKPPKSEHYCCYLKACRNLADKLRINLRTLDCALWISSKNYDC